MEVKNKFGRIVDVPLSHAGSVLDIDGITIISVDDEVFSNPEYRLLKAKVEKMGYVHSRQEAVRDIEDALGLDYSTMSYNDLKKHGKQKGLKIAGVSKANLIKALQD